MNRFLAAAISAALLIGASDTLLAKNNTISIVPQPEKVRLHGSGTLSLEGARVTADAAFAQDAANYIHAFGATIPQGNGAASIDFRYNPRLGKEAYVLKVGAKGASIEASSLNGVVYAVQTIRQLGWALPFMTVEDSPRFSYRGMHLDSGRHFWDVDEVKRFIDAMELHKLNTLHWHLTEDQGWRVEIKKYPRLTEVGAWRAQTIIGHTSEYDGIPYGGFYTQDEIREVVAYAAARGITIIPELDLPGHMQAALAAYPELGCTGGPYKVWEKWGISDDVLCIGNEKVFTFLEDVIDEFCELFPGEYFHIGGDECPKSRWHECPKCRALMDSLGLHGNGDLTAEDYLQSYVTRRMADYLASKGRKIIGWDEILQGEIPSNAAVMSYRGTAGGIQASEMGHDAIMTPNIYCYFDFYQSRDIAAEPVAIGGYLPVYRVYNYEPCEDMNALQASHIIGVQANLWTEYIAEPSYLEYMLLPRLAALSEVQWCQPARKDWTRFKDIVVNNLTAIYDAQGWNYARHIFEPGFGDDPRTKSIVNLAHGKDAQSLTTPWPDYALHCPAELFDGKLGENFFAGGDWIGYCGQPLSVVVKMGSAKFSNITFSTLVDKPSYIFNLTHARISVSSDGVSYTVIAEKTYPADTASDPEELRCYSIDLPAGTKARYLKIEAGTIPAVPSWLNDSGATPFLFVDEIIVR